MSTKNAYRLINPYMEGTVEPVVRSKNAFRAGKKLYNTISKYFTNQVDNFYMTVQNVETKDISHFKIDESRNNDAVEFNISKLDGSFSPDIDKKLTTAVEKMSKSEKQNGGRRNNQSRRTRRNNDIDQDGGRHRKHYFYEDDDDTDTDSDYSDSDSDSDVDYFKFATQPISRFVYFYLPYYKLNTFGMNPLDVSRMFMPMFNLPINPSLEIRFDIYKPY